MVFRYVGVAGRSIARFVETISAWAVWLYVFVTRRRDLIVSLLLTLIFFYPSLRAGARTAGLLYTGDVLGYYWPTLAKMQELLSRFHFWALDINLFNGSSEFFLPANFFGAHPLFVLFGVLSGPFSVTYFEIGWFLVGVLAFESFLACFFLLRLAQRDFGLSFGASVFAATFYVFGFGIVDALETPMFIFCVAMVPPCAYAMLRFQERPSLFLLPCTALPAVVLLLGGYIPLGLASLLLAIAIVAARLFLFAPTRMAVRERVARFVVSGFPIVLAAVVVAPFLLASYFYLANTPSSTRPDLFYSAHQLGDLPNMALRLLSSNLKVPGHDYVFPVHWGLVAVYTAVMFALSRRASCSLTIGEWRILKISLVGYFATLLATFGVFSPVSDLVYYFVPQIGGMHLYQRFLFAANILLGLSLAVMLQGLIRAVEITALRMGVVVALIGFVSAAFAQAHFPDVMTRLGMDDAFVFELLVLVLFAAVLVVPGEGFRFAAAVILVLLMPLNAMYERSRGEQDRGAIAAQQPAMLDMQTQRAIIDYLKSYSDNTVIKYVDLTPLWSGPPEEFWEHHEETFPKSFPYLVLNDLALSSYGGFSFYLAPPASYMEVMRIRGQYELQPDWGYARRTGAEFIVARESALGRLRDAGLVGRDANVFRLPDDVVIAPIEAQEEGGILFANGVFKVRETRDDWAYRDLAEGKPTRQSGTIGGAEAQRAVDGRTDGDFAAGTVTHTNEDPDAWLDIDLEGTSRIDEIRIWNRTDCCGARLDGAWVLVSDEPFGEMETAAEAQSRAWSRLVLGGAGEIKLPTGGIEGRYIRLQLGGSRPSGSDFLHVAEIEVLQRDSAASPPGAQLSDASFESNGANRFALETTSTEPVVASWLLWNGRRLSYRLDGEAIEPVVVGGVATVTVPEGRHRLEVTYSNPILFFFWLIYAAYGLSLVVSALVFAVGSWAQTRRPATNS